jgi:hypothetical protein
MPRKTNTTKDLAPALPVRQELLDQLVPGPLTPAQFETLFRGVMTCQAAAPVCAHGVGGDDGAGGDINVANFSAGVRPCKAIEKRSWLY